MPFHSKCLSIQKDTSPHCDWNVHNAELEDVLNITVCRKFMPWLTEIARKEPKFICRDLSGFVRICRDLSGFVGICRDFWCYNGGASLLPEGIKGAISQQTSL